MPSSRPLRRRLQVSDHVVVGAGLHEDVAVAHRGREAAGVVRPHVERASRHQIEAGVMPVTGDETGLDRALVEGEAQVGAPVLDGVRGALVPEHHDRHRADLGEEAALLLQLGERPGPDLGDRRGGGIVPARSSGSFHKSSIAII